MQSNFVFTPGQREEALSWIKEKCPVLHQWIESTPMIGITKDTVLTLYVDLYFKLKGVSIDILPTEFIVGIEYKDAEKVKIGEEAVNIRFQNPRRPEGKPCDELAQAVLIKLLQSLKS